MDHVTQLNQLGQCLAGVFQNRQQALAAPAWFVHLRLWSCPVALFTEDSFTFFIEQASAAFTQPPYRQRLLRVRWSQAAFTGDLTAEYYALKQPQAFQGAAQAPERLQALTPDDLQPLTGSRLQVTPQLRSAATCFEARHYPGERCQFAIDGEIKYVELAFDAISPVANSQEQAAFLMYDKGMDPDTGKATWGALRGPFELQKVEDLSASLSLFS
ncbi:MAG: chromophore lyase CpcT/CpeT [Leptolyngbya sp. SIO1E4]|nr:chromophore lyase CpcT/CpeT [Leptolyngbya sp. SIO1E4]